MPEGTSRLRLAVMASHTKSELRDAARALGRAALRCGFRPSAGVPIAEAQERSHAPRTGAPAPVLFDGEADIARAA